jgi:CRISPR-associated protein Cas4
MINDDLDYLPLSYLNQLEYCERRFWLMFVEGEIAINAPMLDGIYRHERAHDQGSEQRGEVTTYRQVYVWSQQLRLAGLADFIEDEAGRLLPVEHKHGKIGKWLNDHIQLCAQACAWRSAPASRLTAGRFFTGATGGGSGLILRRSSVLEPRRQSSGPGICWLPDTCRRPLKNETISFARKSRKGCNSGESNPRCYH